MAKLVVQHDGDPAIGIVLEYTEPGTPGKAEGYSGTCTECGWPIHRWQQNVLAVIQDAQAHVDAHEAQVLGVDPSSVVR